MRRILLAACVMLAAPAYAQTINNHPNSRTSWQQNGNGPHQMQAQNVDNVGNSRTSVDASSRDRTIVAPSLPGMASGPCTGAGGGVSGGIWPLTGGVSVTTMDDRCTARETARMLDMVGLRSHAQSVMLREYARVMGETYNGHVSVTAPATAFSYNTGN